MRTVGFENIEIKNSGVLEAKLRDGWGRVHVLGITDGKKTWLDVHRDALIHVVFIGVDYSKKPEEICKRILENAMKAQATGRVIGGASWFDRKNKAMVRGARYSTTKVSLHVY